MSGCPFVLHKIEDGTAKYVSHLCVTLQRYYKRVYSSHRICMRVQVQGFNRYDSSRQLWIALGNTGPGEIWRLILSRFVTKLFHWLKPYFITYAQSRCTLWSRSLFVAQAAKDLDPQFFWIEFYRNVWVWLTKTCSVIFPLTQHISSSTKIWIAFGIGR